MITTSTYARGVYHLTFTSDLDEPKMRSLNFPSPSAPPNFSWSFSFRPGGGGGVFICQHLLILQKTTTELLMSLHRGFAFRFDSLYVQVSECLETQLAIQRKKSSENVAGFDYGSGGR